MTDLWTYRADLTLTDVDLGGYEVEAKDGHIGKVDEADWEAGTSYLVVDTGFWIFGKKRVIPAGVIMKVDHDGRTVHINMTKDDVKSAPDWDESWNDAPDTRAVLNDYFDIYRW
jgi:hypothetical protein